MSGQLRSFQYFFLAAVMLFNFTAENVRGDVSWLSKVNNCTSFSRELNNHISAVGDLQKINVLQKAELEKILEEACAMKFQECGFEICGHSPVKSSSLSSGRKSSTPDISPPALAWLKEGLSCDQFRAELRKRYSSLGPFSSLPDDKKSELRVVLETSCGERFKHCQFKNCPKAPTVTAKKSASISPSQAKTQSRVNKAEEPEDKTEEPENKTEEPENKIEIEIQKPIEDSDQLLRVEDTVTTLAREQFNELRDKFREKQRAIMAKAIAKEKKAGVVWTRMYNPVELSILKNRQGELSQPKRLVDTGKN